MQLQTFLPLIIKLHLLFSLSNIIIIIMSRTSFLLLFTLFFIAATSASHHNRRHLLHQPFFPQITILPPTQPPSLPPHPLPHPQTPPKYPFSTTPTTPQQPFFPSLPSPPPPPPPASSFLSTFPANISSLLFPHHPPSTSFHRNLILTISVSLSFLFAAVLAVVASFFIWSRRTHHHHTPPKTDSLRLFPPDTVLSDGSPKPPKLPHRPDVPNTSSEFLYLGTLVNPHSGVIDHEKIASLSNASVKSETSSSTRPYQKLGSPELNPLPPLPRYNIYTPTYRSGEVLVKKEEADADTDEGEEFFSPRGSSGRKETLEDSNASVVHNESSSRRHNYGSTSFNSRTASYPYSNSCSPSISVSTSPSLVLKMSPLSSKSKSPDTIISFRAPVQVRRTYSPSGSLSASSSSPSGRGSGNTQNSPDQIRQAPGRTESATTQQFVPTRLPPPPPPPPPPPRFWELPVGGRMVEEEVNLGSSGPPVLVTPSRPAFVNEQMHSYRNVETNEETLRPKLKPLHWDKVRASSDRAMVWDQIKSSSFQLNEEMIETLFVVNNSHFNDKDNKGRRLSLPLPNQENRVLDPKKSQNIAILLRALNVTIDEVCEALLEGNSDTLGTELLESLLKMALTEEEEHKLREFEDESPFKLGPAEKFLKAVLDVPFAFKRIDAMLYITNFDSEVEYLRKSFETLEAASEELKNSRMFLKLLEAVLKTGNRMNVGTNRGDAHAFKLDTLLKLVDVKGTDGKTTLLHFVVQEIIRSEGSRISGANENLSIENAQQSAFQDDVKFRKLGLQVVSGLCGELTNVKKAAAMDSDVLISDVSKLATGITKIMEVLKLNEEIALKESSWRFSESMKGFLKKAEEEIVRIQAQEKVVLSLVKEITEYFHGSSVKEEAHPVRIFTVVRDFLSILDQVCREVGKINERTICSSVRPMLETSILPPVFPGLNGQQHYGSTVRCHPSARYFFTS